MCVYCFAALLTTRPPKVLFPSERQPTIVDVQLGESSQREKIFFLFL